jgi:hypothetical protein
MKGVPIMPEYTELGSDLGQLADNLLWQMRNYLNAVHSKLAALDAVLAAQAPPVEQRPIFVDREKPVKPPVGIGGHQPEP